MNDTTTSSLSGLMAIFYSKDFLARAKQMMVYDVGAQKRPMPANSGKVVYFNRFTQLSAATSALTEETLPSATALSTTIVSATVAQYGSYGTVSDLFELTSIDEGLRETVAVFAEQGAFTVDTLIKTALGSGATTQLAGGKSNITDIATSDVLSGSEIRKAVKTLKKNGAHKFDDGFFKGIVPVSAVYDLMGNSEWINARIYTNATDVLNGEVGRLYGVTFYETNNETTTSSTTTVYSTFIFGKNAYGTVDISGGSNVEIFVKKPGTGDTSNPLNLFSTVGWKIKAFVAKVLNTDWIIAVKTGTQG